MRSLSSSVKICARLCGVGDNLWWPSLYYTCSQLGNTLKMQAASLDVHDEEHSCEQRWNRQRHILLNVISNTLPVLIQHLTDASNCGVRIALYHLLHSEIKCLRSCTEKYKSYLIFSQQCSQLVGKCILLMDRGLPARPATGWRDIPITKCQYCFCIL